MQHGGRFSSNNPMHNRWNNLSPFGSSGYAAAVATLAPLNRNSALSAEKMSQYDKATIDQLSSGFVAVAARLHRRYSGGHISNPDFPLCGPLSLRSNISLAFNDRDIHDCELGETKAKLWLNILTLAGVNGVLPSRLTEDMLAAKRRGGDALHEFFDLLNRRFWELLFQSYRLGTRPQYGFNNHSAQVLIQGLAQCYVGLRDAPIQRQTITSPEYQGYFLRHCFHIGRGTGGPGGLAELLSRAVARPVTVSDWAACNIPVPIRYQMRLGSSRAPALLGGKSIVGRCMQVRRFLWIDVAFTASDLPQFCPTAGGWAIRAIIGALHTCLAGRVVLTGARYKILVQPVDVTLLGQVECQLGWSARLGGAAAHTSLIQVSHLAIANIEKNQ